MNLNVADFIHALPLIVVALWGCLVLLISALGANRSVRLGPVTALGTVFSIAVCLWSWAEHAEPQVALFSGMLLTDRFALFLDVVFLVAALLTTLLSSAYLEEHDVAEGEFFGLMLLAVSGMMMLVHAADFIMLVIGLETMSLAIYSLVACWSGRRKSAEAGLKYFVMGAVASAFLLYGIALLYGVTGVTNLGALAAASGAVVGDPLFIVGMLLVLGGLAFKVAMVPFHMWTPDAYEGAPTPITGFMAAAVKAAGFGVLLRVVTGAFAADFVTFGSTGWVNIFWTLSVLTMTVGNIAALRQDNIKRLLAYSSVSHAGYIVIGVLTLGVSGGGDAGPVLSYLLQYALTTIGAFGVVAWIGGRQMENVGLEDWAGLAGRHPAAALAMTLFLLSLAGLPPTSGFFAKLYIFKAALTTDSPGLLLLVIIAALNSVISIFYYLRPVVAMYFRDPLTEDQAGPLRSGALNVALVTAALLVLLLGLLPGSSLEWAGQSALAALGG